MAFVWWMYAADVVGSASTVLTLAAVLAVLGYGVWAIVSHVEDNDRPPFTPLKWAMICAAVATAIPSQKTMYAIAATSAGKEAAATPTGQKAIKALDVWLDRQIAGEPKK